MLCDIVSMIDNNDITWIYNPSYMRLFNNYILLTLSISHDNMTSEDYKNLTDILYILNTIYEYSGDSIIDDDIYDSLQNLYQKYSNGVQFKDYNKSFNSNINLSTDSFNNMKNSLYTTIETPMFYGYNTKLNDEYRSLFRFNNDVLNFDSELTHKGNLVGTLDKCKFILECDVPDNMKDLSNITILERDFFGKHIKSGIYGPNDIISVTCELKFDGISVECLISNGMIKSAITRGDLYNNTGVNRIQTLRNKFFNNHQINNIEDDIVKFEAIISYIDMMTYNRLNCNGYKNPRTCISGLMNRLDSENFSDLITLVPLKSKQFDYLPRSEEIEVLNNLYSNRVNLNNLYRVFSGNYIEVLYQIKMFLNEANEIRDNMPFMYDGIVITYNDQHIKDTLGRVSNVDKYSIALKFPSLFKITTFRSYSYTIGKDGRITPMAHYDLIEFIGTHHSYSSLHSYKRYKELGLVPGEKIRVDYVNDCMCYISKYEDFVHDVPDIICPSCGSSTEVISDMCYCTNINCEGRLISRTVDMLSKLGFDGISSAFVEKTKIFNLYDILTINRDFLISLGFGTIQTENILNEINKIINTPIYDYNFIGSFGFTGISNERFKLILNVFNISELLEIINSGNSNVLLSIKGIGNTIINILDNEFNIFIDDIIKCLSIMNVIQSKGSLSNIKGKVRISGLRDDNLCIMLEDHGYEVSYGSVTKNTSYLIVPSTDYTSTKVNNAKKYNIPILTINEIEKIL